LRASEDFQSLQKDLAEIEDQLHLARRPCNGAVRDFNAVIEQFPSNLMAFSFSRSPRCCGGGW
jgi:LemA protein